MSKKPKRKDGKPTSLTITIDIPEDVKTTGMTITPEGDVELKGEDGAPVPLDKLTRAITHQRPKGAKVRTRQTMDRGAGAIGGLRELSRYTSIFVIDTNTRKIEGSQVSATAFICCRLEPDSGGYRVKCEEGRVNIYEFHGAVDKPELLAIFKLARDIAKSSEFDKNTRIAMVTDTELDAHDDINARRKPIYGQHHLPEGFRLMYASADTGQEVLNKLLRLCDRQASKHLEDLRNSVLEDTPLRVLEEDGTVKCRVGRRNAQLIVEKNLVREVRLQPGANITVWGLRK